MPVRKKSGHEGPQVVRKGERLAPEHGRNPGAASRRSPADETTVATDLSLTGGKPGSPDAATRVAAALIAAVERPTRHQERVPCSSSCRDTEDGARFG